MLPLLHGWTSVQRTAQTHWRLGVSLFFVAGASQAGALSGALGFKTLGYVVTLPLALHLLWLVLRPVLDDARNWIAPH